MGEWSVGAFEWGTLLFEDGLMTYRASKCPSHDAISILLKDAQLPGPGRPISPLPWTGTDVPDSSQPSDQK